MTNDATARPGGLTVLAVFNFVVAGFALIGIVGLAAVMAMPDLRASMEEDLGAPVTGRWLAIMLATAALVAALLIVSGIGYLQRQRVRGRLVGNLYALVDLASTGYDVTLRGFDLQTMIGLVYPVLTLLLVNVTFKDDLVR